MPMRGGTAHVLSSVWRRGARPADAAANPFVSMEVFQNSVVTQKDFKTLKENWIRKQLLLRAREYTEYKKLSYVPWAPTQAA